MSAAEEVRMKKAVLMGVDVVCTTLNHCGSQHIVDMMYHQDATKHHFGCVIVDEVTDCLEWLLFNTEGGFEPPPLRLLLCRGLHSQLILTLTLILLLTLI